MCPRKASSRLTTFQPAPASFVDPGLDLRRPRADWHTGVVEGRCEGWASRLRGGADVPQGAGGVLADVGLLILKPKGRCQPPRRYGVSRSATGLLLHCRASD